VVVVVGAVGAVVVVRRHPRGGEIIILDDYYFCIYETTLTIYFYICYFWLDNYYFCFRNNNLRNTSHKVNCVVWGKQLRNKVTNLLKTATPLLKDLGRSFEEFKDTTDSFIDKVGKWVKVRNF
jgi:hypothetical protein